MTGLGLTNNKRVSDQAVSCQMGSQYGTRGLRSWATSSRMEELSGSRRVGKGGDSQANPKRESTQHWLSPTLQKMIDLGKIVR